MTRALVTGATGFIGRRLVAALSMIYVDDLCAALIAAGAPLAERLRTTALWYRAQGWI
jgi:thioester reductase-like protein